MLSSSQIDFAAAANLSESIKQPATAAAFQSSVMMEHLWPSVSTTHHLASPLSQQLQPVPQFSTPPLGTNTAASSSSSALYSNAAKHLTHHGFATNAGMDHFHHAQPPSFSSIASAGESLFSNPAAMSQTSRQLPSTLHSMLGGVSAAHSSNPFYSPYINNSGLHQWAPPTVSGNDGGRTTTLPSHPQPPSTSTSALNAFSALGFHHCSPGVGGNGVFQSAAGASFNQLSMAASGGVGGRSGGTSSQLIDLSNHVVSRRLSLSLAGGSGLSLPVKMAGHGEMVHGLTDGSELAHAPMQLPTRLNVAYIPLESPKRDHSSSSGMGATKSSKLDRHPHLSSHHQQQQHLQHEHKQPEVTCQVCHQAASNGLHFGARTCAACAAFFRRSISDQKRYACKRSQRCVIRPGEVQGYRKMCRSCRIKRCMEIGMLPENVQNKRHRRELYYSSLSNSNSLLEGGALNDAVHPPPQLSDQSLASVPEQPQQVPTPAAHYEFHPQQQPPTGLTIPEALSNLSLIHQLQQQQQQSSNT